MDRRHPTRWAAGALITAAVAAALLFGTQLRLSDPLSSESLPAEDPFTHVALAREHLADGRLDPLNEGGRLYPPGLHAVLGAFHAFTGATLYDLARFGPPVLGAIGILGVALLLGRFEGHAAALAAALALALAPEAVLRTAMMAPTALDLALLPFLLLALLHTATGRLGWALVAAALVLFLVFAHPWLLTILAAAGAAFLLAALVAPWPRTRGRPVTAQGLAATLAILGVAWGLAAWGCVGACGPGFADVVPGGDRYNALGLPVAAASILAAFGLVAARQHLDPWLARPIAAPRPSAGRIAASVLLLAALAVATLAAVHLGLPEFVDLPGMLGWPALVLAALAFATLPFAPGPAAHAGFALALATYPLVVFNPLSSPFWPHRTAVYLGVGVAILAGVAVASLARLAASLTHARMARVASRARPALVALPPLLVAASLAGTVWAATPEAPETGWYRLYPPCPFDALENVSRRAAHEPSAIVVTGAWQSKLVVAALAPDASRAWFKPDFFTSASARDGVLRWAAQEERPLLVVVDPQLGGGNAGASTAFLHEAPWRETGAWCPSGAGGAPAVALYRLEEGGAP